MTAGELTAPVRVPPHNIEAEEGVLGAMMLSKDAIAAVLELLREEDFYRPAHRTVWRAILALHHGEQPTDAVAVSEHLRRDGVLQDIGGVPFLHTLVASVPTPGNADYYARIVLEAGTLRRLIDVGTRIVQLGFEAPQDTERAVELARKLVAQLDGRVTPSYVTLDQVKHEQVRWLWPGRIPLGKLAILEGDPERAKSTITLDLAARVSTGTPMPGEGGRRDPAGVVVVSAEDDAEDTIVPRLLAHGGDRARVAHIPVQRDGNGQVVPLTVPEDIGRLDQAIRGVRAALLVIDPISAFLSERVFTNNDASVRGALAPLADLAQRTGCAVLLVRHLNKQGDLRAKYRGGGSIAFTAAARAVLVVDEHPDEPGLMVLARVKSNLARAVPSIGYRIESEPLYESPYVRWQAGTVDLDAEALLRGQDGRAEAPARREAEELLRDLLLADGPLPASQVKKLLADAGVSPRTLDRAKSKLGVRADRQRDERGKTVGWLWSLPAETEG